MDHILRGSQIKIRSACLEGEQKCMHMSLSLERSHHPVSLNPGYAAMQKQNRCPVFVLNKAGQQMPHFPVLCKNQNLFIVFVNRVQNIP